MNKVEFAVCRIRQILPKNEVSFTRGSACVVKCEWLSSARGWKCPYVLVTSSHVLHRDELASGKAFVADFLVKEKKGLETFDLKLAADSCVDIPACNALDVTAITNENCLPKGQSMTIISVEKLDKRGFLKRLAKKSSLQTTRPLECFDTAKLHDEISEGLYCHVIREGGQDFSTRTYKFLFVAETRHYVLQDFGNTEISSIRGFPNDEMPLGAVIYTKRGEFAGLLEFSGESIDPSFFPKKIRLSTEANGEQAGQAISNNNASAAQAGEDQAENPDKDSEKESLDEATNEEEGKDTQHTEDSCREGYVVGSHGDSNTAKDQVPFDISTRTTSIEAARSTTGQSDVSVSKLQVLPVVQFSVLVEKPDNVVVEVHAKAGSSSGQNSYNGVGERHEEQNSKVDKTELVEIVMPVGGAEDTFKNEEDTACELFEKTSETQTLGNLVSEGTSMSQDSTLITVTSVQEGRGLVNESKVDEELFNSPTASDEHTSSVQRTVLDKCQFAEFSSDKQIENKSATTTAVIQTPAESDTETARDFESALYNLNDEEPTSVNSGAEQRGEAIDLPGAAGIVTDELVDEKADDTLQKEQSETSPICIPETHLDTHNLDKESVEATLSTTCTTVANVAEEKENEKSPESRYEEPSEKLVVEPKEQELNVAEVSAGKVEEAENTEEREAEDQEEREEDIHETIQEAKEGDREAKSVAELATEEQQRCEQTVVGPPAIVQDIKRRESEAGESTPEQDQGEDTGTTATGDGTTAVTDKEDKGSGQQQLALEQGQEEDKVTTAETCEGEEAETGGTYKGEKEREEQDNYQEEVKVTTATDEGEDGETAVADTDDKDVTGKGDEVDKKECGGIQEVQREDQAQDKEEEEERAEGIEEKKNDAEGEMSTAAEEITGEEEGVVHQKIEAQEQEKDEDEEDQDVQLQNQVDNDKEKEEQLTARVHVQGEGDEKEEERVVQKVHNEAEGRADIQVQKVEEEKDVKVHNQDEEDEEAEVEKVPSQEVGRERVKVHNQDEEDEEAEVEKVPSQEEGGEHVKVHNQVEEDEEAEVEKVQSQEEGGEHVKVHNTVEEDEEAEVEKVQSQEEGGELMKVHNQIEEDEEAEVEKVPSQEEGEHVKVHNQVEEDEEAEVEKVQSQEEGGEHVKVHNTVEEDEEAEVEKVQSQEEGGERVKIHNQIEEDEEAEVEKVPSQEEGGERVKVHNQDEEDEEAEVEKVQSQEEGGEHVKVHNTVEEDEEAEVEKVQSQEEGGEHVKVHNTVEEDEEAEVEKVQSQEEGGEHVKVHNQDKEDEEAEVEKVPSQEEGGERVKVHNQDEEDEEAEVEKVQSQEEGGEHVKVHNQDEEDEEAEVEKVQSQEEGGEHVKVHNQVENNEKDEEAKVYIQGEKDDEIEVNGNEDHDPRERTKQIPSMKQEEEENASEEEADNLSDIVAQRIDADSLLSEIITNNSRVLDELARCLDTDYQYSLLPSWRDLADLLAIPPEAYEHYDVYSVSSPTEDLFVFLASTKPDLTMKDIREALAEIGRSDVVQIMDNFTIRNLISNESVVGSLVEREDRDLLGKMALKLDRGSTITWKHLAEELAIPRRVYRNFGSNRGYNSALLLLKYLPIFVPELTIADLKEVLENILRADVAAVLRSAGIPDDEHVRDILDDAELMDQITDLLNEEAPMPNWRQLAKELKVPREKCQLFEPTADERSCTKLLFRSLEKSEPDITVEELILALVAMKRQDVVDVLAKYLDGDDIDLILEENNLLLDESHNNFCEGDTAN